MVHDFDPPDDPWGSGHRGVDLAGTVGQSVHSALAGTVAFVGTIAGKPVVTVSHGDTRTTYEPVSSTLEVGATVVTPGQRIGSLELPFSHCFPAACLHWGWLQRRRPTSIRSTSSATAGCGCSRCGATSRSTTRRRRRPGVPPSAAVRRVVALARLPPRASTAA